jgi:murein DD-endopeptidase MepM/ murein hydrolase activator NlpD
VSPLPVLALAAAGTAFLLLAAHPAEGSVEMVPGAIVSQPFGCTALELEPVDSSCPGGHFHSGIDLAAPSGTPILAPGAGVARVGAGGPCGIHVLLQHGAGMETLFCHLSEASVVDGQPVAAGQPIGKVGATGFATGPHVHFEVHRNGRAVDPAAWLRRIPATTNLHGGK